jgi:xanthine/CO dehydrogenase XdhC/CoxF family maturation factor
LPLHFRGTDPTYLVLTIRGVSIDIEGLTELIITPSKSIGMISSKRRLAKTVKQITKSWISPTELSRVNFPTGLKLNAATIEEFAFSNMAEIILIHHYETGKPMKAKP